MAASDTRSDPMFDEVIVQIVSQKLGTLLSHPVCVECLSMQTRVKDAKVKLARIQEFFTQYRPSKATEWSGRLLRAMYYAEEFIDKFHLREARERQKALHMAAWPLAALVSKYKLWRDLSILVSKMEELCNDQFLKGEAEGNSKKIPGSSSSHASVRWQGKKFTRLTSFWDRQAATNFSCRKKEEIIKCLKAKGYIEISIWGEQGTGKTFLARWAYSQAKYFGRERRAWVHVSPSMDEGEFLLELLKQAENPAGDAKDMSIEEIRAKLFRTVAELNKVLIVLDDVQLSNWRSLVGPLWRNLRGTQALVITTTRYKEIANYMCYRDRDWDLYPWPIKLEKLDVVESQKMLDWKLHRVSDGQEFSSEEKGILSMCGGLPLSISLLSGFLSNAGEHDHAALAKEDSKMALVDILQLSCHKLPVHLKPCFIYMALFPIGLPIPTRRLVRLWLAEGLLDSHCHDIERKRTRQPEDVGETFILELAYRNVIDVVSWRADGSPKACQMVTSLYDVIRPIAMSTGLLHIHATSKLKDGDDRDPTSQQLQLPAQLRERIKIQWLAEHTDIVTDDRGGSYPNLNLGHVRSFLSFYQRRGMLTKDISAFLRKMTSKTDYSLLRVLDLEGVYKPSLDGVLHKLVLLRYLGLRSTVLDSLPSAVVDLFHLETLDIKHTNITLLPSSFWKARNLRHLHLNWFYIDLKKILKAYSNNVNDLAQLQTLSGLVIGEVKESLMRDHMDSLTTLTTLKLFLQGSSGDTPGAAGEAVADWISSRLTNLQSLTFGVIQEDKPVEKVEPATSLIGPLPKLSLAEKHHDLFELYLLGQLNKPIWTQLLPVSLRVLTLSGSRVKIDMMPELGGLLRHLRTFRLLANSFQGACMTFAKEGFPSLKILKIWNLPQLKEVIIEPGAMLHLKELELRHLDAVGTIQGINKCEELENICVVGKKDPQKLVNHLKEGIGKKVNSYKLEDRKTPESRDDEEDDRDKKGEKFYLYVEK
ncbi:hypothetical protein ACJRO7_005324 [Eucalyptus globulus]|uniref:NB-ARC domain-containing protein n=1 Tax=Eucalyptus globulus TaxID=34317 RepID=A0ABD3J302_EUCGL